MASTPTLSAQSAPPLGGAMPSSGGAPFITNTQPHATPPATPVGRSISVIEFHMMDKRKFYPLSILSGVTVRSLLHPFNVIRTRLQVQKHRTVYRGTFDALLTIAKNEGRAGLYKGLWVNNLTICSQLIYVTTYESMRQLLRERAHVNDTRVRSLVAGGCASAIGQTFVVPIDIVSQHLMMYGGSDTSSGHTRLTHQDNLHLNQDAMKGRYGGLRSVVTTIYSKYGMAGFYKGYIVSLCTYAPGSAFWWMFYDVYCGLLDSIMPTSIPRLLLQVAAGPMGGVTTTTLMNPMDTVRTRIQVEGHTFFVTARNLWREESLGIFTKGLSARVVQSTCFSFFLVLGYETIKRWSLLPQYKDDVRW